MGTTLPLPFPTLCQQLYKGLQNVKAVNIVLAESQNTESCIWRISSAKPHAMPSGLIHYSPPYTSKSPFPQEPWSHSVHCIRTARMTEMILLFRRNKEEIPGYQTITVTILTPPHSHPGYWEPYLSLWAQPQYIRNILQHCDYNEAKKHIKLCVKIAQH